MSEVDPVMVLAKLQAELIGLGRQDLADLAAAALGEVRRLEVALAAALRRASESGGDAQRSKGHGQPQSKRSPKVMDSRSPSAVQANGQRRSKPMDSASPNGLDTLSLSLNSESDPEKSCEKAGEKTGSGADPSARASESEGGPGGQSNGLDSDGPSNGQPQSKHNGQPQSKARGQGDGNDELGPLGPTGLTLRVAMQDAWDGVQGAATSGSNRAKIWALAPRVRALAAERELEPETFFRAAVKRFKADPRTKAKKHGLSIFLEDFDLWCDDEPVAGPGSGGNSNRGAAYQPFPSE